MTSYYAQKLSAERLQRCYALGGARVQQYLECEIRHALSRLKPTDSVLELGCGYGRIVLRMAAVAARATGIDVADDSLAMARRLAAQATDTDPTGPGSRCSFARMDALALDFEPESFDAVMCLQNGIGAFRVDAQRLLRESLRVLRPGGVLLLSTYTDAFWPHRLAWFEAQAAEGLVGPVDHAASRGGVIVCTDGFRSGRATREEFQSICAPLNLHPRLYEIDESSLWCEITKPAPFPTEERGTPP